MSIMHGQTAGWIKMPLGKEIGLGPGHVVLDGTTLSRKGAQQPPIFLFDPCLLWPNGRPSQQLLSSCGHLFARTCPTTYSTRQAGMRSVSTALLEVSTTRTAIGDWSFSIDGPRVSNSLPAAVCDTKISHLCAA